MHLVAHLATVNKKSTTGQEKAAGDPQEPFTLDILQKFTAMQSKLCQQGYIILQFFENCFTIYLCIDMFYFMFMKNTL